MGYQVTVLGIDYSLTSPALCVYHGAGDFNLENISFHYLTDVKKSIQTKDYLNGKQYPSFESQEQRYHQISNWVLDVVNEYQINSVFIEGYAFNAVGRVFQIAENTGVLKYRLNLTGLEPITVPPTVIKKYATGKGNANKEKMDEAFTSETGVNLKQALQLTDKQWNPSSDIIDSFYICKYGVLEYGKEK